MAEMVKKFCPICGQVCWHNPMAASKTSMGGLRCTNCAHPVGTGLKRERHETMQKRALARAGRM